MPPRKTVLIADDDKTAVTMMGAALRQAGINVLVAQDSMQAVMGAHKQQLDAIVLDVNMPGGTGITVLEKLKASTRTQLIPVLVVSGSTDSAIPEKVVGLGATEFLKKPVSPTLRQQKVCALLGVPAPGQGAPPA